MALKQGKCRGCGQGAAMRREAGASRGQCTPHLRFYRASRYSVVVMRFYWAAEGFFTGVQNCCITGGGSNYGRMVVGGVRIVYILISVSFPS